MRILWKQIEPQVAKKVGARLSAAAAAVGETRPEANSVLVSAAARESGEPQSLEMVWSLFALLSTSAILCLYVSICFHLTGPLLTLMLTLLPVALLLVLLNPPGVASASRPASHGRRHAAARGLWLSPNDARQRTAFADTADTRAERLYGEIVLLLADSSSPLDARVGRDILRQCNALVADSFRVEAQHRKVERLLGAGGTAAAQEIARGEAEHAALQQRFDACPDPLARRSLGESVALCAERVETLRALAPMVGRLEAHQEVICQALLLARAALAREQVAPVALHAPDVSGLRQIVRRIGSQTRAVEEAVAEVISL